MTISSVRDDRAYKAAKSGLFSTLAICVAATMFLSACSDSSEIGANDALDVSAETEQSLWDLSSNYVRLLSRMMPKDYSVPAEPTDCPETYKNELCFIRTQPPNSPERSRDLKRITAGKTGEEREGGKKRAINSLLKYLQDRGEISVVEGGDELGSIYIVFNEDLGTLNTENKKTSFDIPVFGFSDVVPVKMTKGPEGCAGEATFSMTIVPAREWMDEFIDAHVSEGTIRVCLGSLRDPAFSDATSVWIDPLKPKNSGMTK